MHTRCTSETGTTANLRPCYVSGCVIGYKV